MLKLADVEVKVIDIDIDWLSRAHPYEQPSYSVFRMEDF